MVLGGRGHSLGTISPGSVKRVRSIPESSSSMISGNEKTSDSPR